MNHFLVFRIYAPMMSFGEVAVGESRSSANWPTRSAIFGMVAAALGILRDEEKKLQNLSESLRLGLCRRIPGSILRDYHTVQMPSQKDVPKKTGLFTRKQELEREPDSLNTMLSTREYLCDAVFDAVLQGDLLQLKEIQKSLLQPKFTLYLGRKSCPLGLPLGPELFEAEDFMVALEKYHEQRQIQGDDFLNPLLSDKLVRYQWDLGMKKVKEGDEKITRYDRCISRDKWLFVTREVLQGGRL